MPFMILVVEDDPDTQANLRDILELFEYQTEIVGTINGALSHPNLSEFSYILLDRQLPDGLAEDALPKLRQLAPSASLIIVTGNGDVVSAIAALQHGAADYLLKPIDPHSLRASLERVQRIRDAELRASRSERLAGIGQMMAGIAHESRNAVQRIQSALDMQKLDYGDPKEVEFQAQKIQSANDSLRIMLDEIRDFAAPITLHRENVFVSRIWRRAWENTIGVTSDEKSLAKLHEQLNDLEVQSNIDSFRFEQVFRNLFENSIAACKTSPEVTITCSEINQDNKDMIRISVKDNGSGIPKEHRPHILDPFYTTKQKGTGLGMAIVKRTVESHGGSIRLGDQSSGAEFIIELPRNLPQS